MPVLSQTRNFNTFVSDSSLSGATWSNPGNAKTSDNLYATASLRSGAENSQYLKCTNAGFTISSNVTIVGIQIRVERKAADANTAQDKHVRIVKGGVIGTTERAKTTTYPLTDTYAVYGDSSDLWGESWTPADVNASDFGVAFSSQLAAGGAASTTVSVDHIEATVFYVLREFVSTTAVLSPLATIVMRFYQLGRFVELVSVVSSVANATRRETNRVIVATAQIASSFSRKMRQFVETSIVSATNKFDKRRAIELNKFITIKIHVVVRGAFYMIARRVETLVRTVKSTGVFTKLERMTSVFRRR